MATKKRKIKTPPRKDLSKDLWISPRFSLRGQRDDPAWDHRQIGNPVSARFLELADIALGIRKPESRKKNSGRGSTRVTENSES